MISNIFEMISNYLDLTTDLLIKESSKVKLIFLLSQIRQPILLHKTHFFFSLQVPLTSPPAANAFPPDPLSITKATELSSLHFYIVHELKEKNICV